MININNTETRPCSDTSNKELVDTLYLAWCQVTVLTKTRETFDGIIYQHYHEALKLMDHKQRIEKQEPPLIIRCSSGGIRCELQRQYHDTRDRSKGTYDRMEVLITHHLTLAE